MKCLVKPSLEELTTAALDVSEPEEVEISIRSDGRVLWINVDGICLLRICGIANEALSIIDLRQREETE